MVFETMVKYNGVYYMAGEDVPTGASPIANVKSEEKVEPTIEEKKVEEKPKSTKKKKAE